MEKEKRKTKNLPKIWTSNRFVVVTVLAVAYGLFSFAIFNNTPYDTNLSPAFISFLIFVPIGISATSVYTLPPARRSLLNSIMVAITTIVLFLIVAVISNPYVLFCVILVAAPLIVIGAVIASIVWLAERFSPPNNQKRQLSLVVFVLLLPYLLAPVEANVEPSATIRTVEDEIIIEGSAEQVWERIIRMEQITQEEHSASFYQTMGIPKPVEATLDIEGVGGIRHGEFEYGLTFYEEITVWRPNEAVEFDVDILLNPQSTPVLKQIGGPYFDILSAGYEIEVLDDTRVKLRLHSTYRLSTNFNFYGQIWSDRILHDFQTYVLDIVKNRVESVVD